MATMNSSTPSRARRPLVVRLALWAAYSIGFMVLMLVSALVWLVLRDRAAGERVQERIAELQAAGLPYDHASLEQYYEQGTEEGEVDRWLAVLDAVRSDAFAESARGVFPWMETAKPVLAPSEPWPEEAATSEFLEIWSDLYEEARDLALADRAVRLPIDFDSAPVEVPFTQDVRQLGRLFFLRGQVAIRHRDSAAVRDAILALFGCARAVEKQPLLLSQFIRGELEKLASEELRCALEADVLNIDALKLIQARIDNRPSLGSVWKAAMYSERGEMLPVLTNPPKDSDRVAGKLYLLKISMRSHNALNFMELIDKAASLPTDDIDKFYASEHELAEVVHERVRGSVSLKRFENMVAGISVPMISAGAHGCIQHEMRARLARLAIGIRLYEDQHGALPDNPDQLSELGLDPSKLMPLGGKPFGYRREADKAVLWGFQLLQYQATPDEPPEYLERPPEESTIDTRFAEGNREWVWELPKEN